MSGDQLQQVAAAELRDVDQRRLFWVRLAVATARDAGRTVDDIDWGQFDWDSVRDSLEAWLVSLPEDGSGQHTHQITDWLVLIFEARPRSSELCGVRRWPSFNLAQPEPPPPLQLSDGSTAEFGALTVQQVEDFAEGRTRLALELPSHQEAWSTLRDVMHAAGANRASDLNPTELEVYAAMLGLVEGPCGTLGDFDEGWQAINQYQPRAEDDDPRG